MQHPDPTGHFHVHMYCILPTLLQPSICALAIRIKVEGDGVLLTEYSRTTIGISPAFSDIGVISISFRTVSLLTWSGRETFNDQQSMCISMAFKVRSRHLVTC